MQELTCVHAWEHFKSQWNENGVSITIFSRCPRCDTKWFPGTDEPRIVLARLEDAGQMAGGIAKTRRGCGFTSATAVVGKRKITAPIRGKKPIIY